MSPAEQRAFHLAVGKCVWVVCTSISGLIAFGCGPAGLEQPQALAPVSPEDRLKVLKCYADAYEMRHGKKVELTRKEVDAAERLCAKQNGSVKLSCDTILSAYSDPICAQSVTLLALADNPKHCQATTRSPDREPNINRAKLHEWNNPHEENVRMMRDLHR